MSRSPPTARCRPARRRSPQGRSGATVDEHGLRFYGFLSETMECGVRAAASYISCRYQSLSQRGLSCQMLLVSVRDGFEPERPGTPFRLSFSRPERRSG